MKLTSYFRSTAAYRVRIALNLKDIEHQLDPVNLLTREHENFEFIKHNPEGLIPTLDTGEQVLSQSMAILEYLEEIHPQPSILPSKPLDRALVRGLAQMIVSDIHPLNNLRVCRYLIDTLGTDDNGKMKWYFHWLEQGFNALETRLASNDDTGKCCFGDTATIADICLIPQIYNAKRFNFSLDAYPTIKRIDKHCLQLNAFAQARPEAQLDAI